MLAPISDMSLTFTNFATYRMLYGILYKKLVITNDIDSFFRKFFCNIGFVS
jgi:hypothetical protein